LTQRWVFILGVCHSLVISVFRGGESLKFQPTFFVEEKCKLMPTGRHGRTLVEFIYRHFFDKRKFHLAHADGHVTEFVKDDVSHAGGQQESSRGTCTVPVPPPRARATRWRAAWTRMPPCRPAWPPSGKTYWLIFTVIKVGTLMWLFV
jgi:hypothetical protein